MVEGLTLRIVRACRPCRCGCPAGPQLSPVACPGLPPIRPDAGACA